MKSPVSRTAMAAKWDNSVQIRTASAAGGRRENWMLRELGCWEMVSKEPNSATSSPVSKEGRGGAWASARRVVESRTCASRATRP